MSYRQVAAAAGRPRAYRAVGNILKWNYDPAIPCHRVIRADSQPGGYNRGTAQKVEMLKREGALANRGGAAVWLIVAAGVIVAIGAVVLWQWRPAEELQGPLPTTSDEKSSAPFSTPLKQTVNMKLSSTAFAHDGSIPAKFTCDGEDVSPPLTMAEVPAGTVSLALIVDDPDAPGGDWVHWTVWNISPDSPGFSEGTVPAGTVEGQTDFGRSGWGGPCPPSGEHRYQFKIYALDTTLTLPQTAGKAEMEAAMEGHILEQTILLGRYARI